MNGCQASTVCAERIFSISDLDFIDHYLNEMKRTEDPTSTFYEENGEKNLKAIVSDLFFAGSETRLPYTEAIVLETLRLSSIAALGVPHQLIADTEFHGYFLPKGITIMANLYTIHHDKKIWGEDANLFRPERFLNEDETRVVYNDALIPFSAGRRQCLGESLAKDTLFLFIASILQNFLIGPDPDCPVSDMQTTSGLVVEPKPFNFVLNLRTLSR
ncbi:Vitamin D 25-hydroxylase [Orchesella cincta]|uniref:Vitamin D 25-hydroxylase n=1 Tax=Orchesella cincta TaxID=48709 RepID=A0A1D2M4F2_ORCCI|nr:Vitamin D 25-hydroxylase [Orchesella cincta]